MEMEKWAAFPGREELAEISNLGRCRLKNTGKLLSSYVKKDCGYVIIRLTKNGHRKEFKIHRVVAIAFIPNPDNKPEVNHLRGKLDNRAVSLEWATEEENRQHAWENNLIGGRLKKIDNKDIPFIRENHIELGYEFLSKMFNVSIKTIYGIATGKTRRRIITEIKIPPKKKAYKRVVDIQTGIIYDSAETVANGLGWTAKKLRKMLSGERRNTTAYKYHGTYSSIIPHDHPIKAIG